MNDQPGVSAAMLYKSTAKSTELATVDYVDLDRFMGDWYVIANIPTPFEKNIYNAVESYRLAKPHVVATRFHYRQGGFDGPQKAMEATGFVQDTQTNARWGMQFIWPLKLDYRVIHLADDYGQTIIGRQRRDFVWIMARTPSLDAAVLEDLIQRMEGVGYTRDKLQRVPQHWPPA
ncbi:MAG: lipocalin family protein [Candidatus Competibacterales bacterium]